MSRFYFNTNFQLTHSAKMTNPNIEKFCADMRTHCAIVCDKVDVEMETHNSSWDAALVFWLSGGYVIGAAATGKTKEEAVENAIAQVWPSLYRFDKTFSPCYKPSCDVCARLLGVEVEPEQHELRSSKK
jgi:hypothetical protein